MSNSITAITYEGRHRVPDQEYWNALADGLIRDHARPHSPRHSEAHREVAS